MNEEEIIESTIKQLEAQRKSATNIGIDVDKSIKSLKECEKHLENTPANSDRFYDER